MRLRLLDLDIEHIGPLHILGHQIILRNGKMVPYNFEAVQLNRTSSPDQQEAVSPSKGVDYSGYLISRIQVTNFVRGSEFTMSIDSLSPLKLCSV